jgi:hypothetical protein
MGLMYSACTVDSNTGTNGSPLEINQAVEMMMQTAWAGILGHDRAEFFTIVI